ncbi:hematopoietically-expressed homeobox protein hhex-like [Scyliorhinus canicula]|uniref:hematopoietically-expressed homeobox protein hhex-like n=1 Tax=Scyliorhinus canicula TaxID=7830 RepID=UPI0018F4AC15|nr:hematopoietically-expressed homeobox protein hhex-like [Scyliorhinus canicula]
MDATSLQYKLTLETSSDETGIRQDEVRPTEMVPVLISPNFGMSSAMAPSPLKPLSSGKCHGFYSEDISTCGSLGSAARETVAMSPAVGQYPTNQFGNDSHISSFTSYRHNLCTRSEYPTNCPIYQHCPLEYPRAVPAQTQTDPSNQRMPAFSHSQYCEAPFTGAARNTAMAGVTRHLALGFASQWSTSQNPIHRQRKKRIPYSKQQITELEMAFENNRFLTPEVRLNISFKLGLTERQVKIWFQNQRQKEKKLLRVQQSVKAGYSGL